MKRVLIPLLLATACTDSSGPSYPVVYELTSISKGESVDLLVTGDPEPPCEARRWALESGTLRLYSDHVWTISVTAWDSHGSANGVCLGTEPRPTQRQFTGIWMLNDDMFTMTALQKDVVFVEAHGTLPDVITIIDPRTLPNYDDVVWGNLVFSEWTRQ